VPWTDFEALRTAYDAANDGDVNASFALITPDTVRSGTERGILWWRRASS